MTDANAAAARIPGLYDRTARAWDAVRGGELTLERTWLDRFAALLPPGRAVLDLGCGTGDPVARALLASGFRVTGVDAAPAMVALAQERFPAARHPGAEWRVGDMRALALGRRFDGVLAWHSFFHLTPADQRAMFPVFAAHAAPGAALMFTSGPDAGEVLGEWEGEPLYHGSLAPAEYEALLAAHGFGLVARVLGDPACGGSSVWLARQAA